LQVLVIVTAEALPGSRSIFYGENKAIVFDSPDFTFIVMNLFIFSNSISNAWKDSDQTVVPVVKKLVEAGLRIWIFR